MYSCKTFIRYLIKISDIQLSSYLFSVEGLVFLLRHETFEGTNQRKMDNTMAKAKNKTEKTKEQTMIYKTLHRKLKIEQHEHLKN